MKSTRVILIVCIAFILVFTVLFISKDGFGLFGGNDSLAESDEESSLSLSLDTTDNTSVDVEESSIEISEISYDASEESIDNTDVTSVIFELVPKNGKEITDEGIENTIKILKRCMGSHNAKVVKISDTMLRLDITRDIPREEVIELCSKSGELTFRDTNGEIKLTSSAIKEAYFTVDISTDTPAVHLEFTEAGKELFRQVSAEIAASPDKILSIYLDDELLSSPYITSAISGENGVLISNPAFKDDPARCEELTNLINTGLMEYELIPVEANE